MKVGPAHISMHLLGECDLCAQVVGAHDVGVGGLDVARLAARVVDGGGHGGEGECVAEHLVARLQANESGQNRSARKRFVWVCVCVVNGGGQGGKRESVAECLVVRLQANGRSSNRVFRFVLPKYVCIDK